jgi:hypothetical protein
MQNCWLRRRFPGESRQNYIAFEAKVKPEARYGKSIVSTMTIGEIYDQKKRSWLALRAVSGLAVGAKAAG